MAMVASTEIQADNMLSVHGIDLPMPNADSKHESSTRYYGGKISGYQERCNLVSSVASPAKF